MRSQEKAATCKPRREAAGRTHTADTLIADFKPPERGNISLGCVSHCWLKAVYYFKLKALWKLMSDCCFFHRGKLRLQSEVLLRVTHRPVPHACCCPPRVARGVCCLAGVCATLSALVTLHILSCPILMTLYETGITGPISQMRERRHRKGK